MIKYLGSKRLFVPVLGAIASAVGARSAVDLFTGTTRVAQEFKKRGLFVTSVDCATYSDVLAQCFISADRAAIDLDELNAILHKLNGLEGRAGYFTQAFCEDARYLQSFNGTRVDAIREELAATYTEHPLFPILLSSLMLAADKVDSTTGVQMAYLKNWAPRSYKPLLLQVPGLLDGPGRSVLGDASRVVDELPPVDLAYLDPPYNQHRYFTNYHVWESLVRWDKPDSYGIANKRIDSREDQTKSVFNIKREMPAALESVIKRTKAEVVVVSYNNEAWVSSEEMSQWLLEAGHEEVATLAFDAKRYVGAQIGIHNQAGAKVGTVSHTRNIEYVFIAGPRAKVLAATA